MPSTLPRMITTLHSAVLGVLHASSSAIHDRYTQFVQRCRQSKLFNYLQLSPRMRSRLQRLGSFMPLSVRGLALAALSAVCLLYYALPNSDLSATIITSFFLGLLILLVVRGALAARSIRRDISATLAFDQQQLFSQEAVAAGIILEGVRVAAFYRLGVERIFEHSGVDAARHYLRGQPAFGSNVRLLDSCQFSHRGNWQLQGVAFRLEDNLGLSRFTWRSTQREVVEVQAKKTDVKPLPIVAASSQPGDMLQHTDNRSGDLYDIKAYDPSDGTKRIIWKTYAKSRELVVRRPEPAMVPEGEVAIYSLARRSDDHVASAALAYIEQLEQNNIVVLFGCDVLPSTDAPNCNEPFVAGGYAEEALRLDVWNPELGTAGGYTRFIEALQQHNKYPSQIICYVDKSRLAQHSNDQAISLVRRYSEQYRTQVLFVSVDPSFLHLQKQPQGRKSSKQSASLRSLTLDPMAPSILEAERAEV